MGLFLCVRRQSKKLSLLRLVLALEISVKVRVNLEHRHGGPTFRLYCQAAMRRHKRCVLSHPWLAPLQMGDHKLSDAAMRRVNELSTQ